MHISEGVLPLTTLGVGYALSAAGTAIGLQKLDDRRMASTAMLSCTFFIASFIHIPIGPGSIHLVLNGLLGLLCGWPSFIAIGTALFMQAILFQYGGLTTLGINTFIMALPAILSFLLLRPLITQKVMPTPLVGFIAGAGSVLLSALLLAGSLATAGDAFIPASRLILLANTPLLITDGIISAIALQFIATVKPDMLQP